MAGWKIAAFAGTISLIYYTIINGYDSWFMSDFANVVVVVYLMGIELSWTDQTIDFIAI